MTQTDKPLDQTVTSGEADLDALRRRLTSWLSGRPEVAGGAGGSGDSGDSGDARVTADDPGGVEVGEVTRPDASGRSNISVLFAASWRSAATGEREAARVARGPRGPHGSRPTTRVVSRWAR